MTVTVKNPYGKNYLDLAAGKTLILARRRILYYKTGVNEVLLNKYFIEKYKMSLKKLCLVLLKDCNIMNNGEDIIVKFKTNKMNNIADFITFGNGKIKGSKILLYAFKGIY